MKVMRIAEVITNYRLFLEHPLVSRTREVCDAEGSLQWIARYFYEAYITDDDQVFYITSEDGFREMHRVNIGMPYGFIRLIEMPYHEVHIDAQLDILLRDYPHGDRSRLYAKNLGRVLTQLGEF